VPIPKKKVIAINKIDLPRRLRVSDLPEDYRAGLSRALEQRPDLRRLRERVRQMRLSLDMARGAYLPRVDAGARYYVDDDDFNVDADRDDWTVAMCTALSWAATAGAALSTSFKCSLFHFPSETNLCPSFSNSMALTMP